MVIGAGAASVGLVTPADSRTKIVKVTLSEEFLANTHTAFQLTGHAKVSDTASEKNATLTAEFSVNLEYVESVSTINNFFIYVQYVLDSFPFTPPQPTALPSMDPSSSLAPSASPTAYSTDGPTLSDVSYNS
jgi:hypothetical protein